MFIIIQSFNLALAQRVDRLSDADTTTGGEYFYVQQAGKDRKITLMRLLGMLAASGDVGDSIAVSGLIGDSLYNIRALIDAIDQNITVLQYGDWSTPEEYYGGTAVGNGVINASAYIKQAIDSANGRPVLLQQNYKINDSVKVSGGGTKEVDIIFAKGSKITSSVVAPTTNYYNPTGEIIFENFKRINIDGGEITGNISTTNPFQNVVLFRNCGQIEVNNINVKKGKYCGVRVVGVEGFTSNNGVYDSSHYANVLISATDRSTIIGGEINWGGWDLIKNQPYSADSGYGLDFGGRYSNADPSYYTLNENITVTGVTFKYNRRHALNNHGGKKVTFMGNHILGYGTTGIGGINEDGEYSGQDKWVGDWKAIGNDITQDSAWIESTFAPYHDSTHWFNAIAFGDYSASSSDTLGKSNSWLVSNNLIDCDNAKGARAIIFGSIGASDLQPNPQIESLQIINNQITDARVTDKKFFSNDSPTDSSHDAVIYLTSGKIPPKSAIVAGNIVNGSALNGIKISYINPGGMLLDEYDTLYVNSTNVYGNIINGTFTYPYYISSNNIKSVTSNNTYNGRRVADMDDAYNGKLNRRLRAQNYQDSLLVLDSVEVDTDGDWASYEVDISMTDDVNKYFNKYRYVATAKNVTGTATFSVILLEESTIGINDPTTQRPNLFWRTDGVDNGVLKLIDNNSSGFSKYNIDVRITSRAVPFWRTE